LRLIPSISTFIMKWCGIFWRLFFCIYWDDQVVVVFASVSDVHMLNHPCIPGIKPTYSCCMIFPICCGIQFAIILLRIFPSMFIKEIGLWFSYLDMSFSGFGMSVILAS
jgi:hypothetical protein